MKKYVFLGFMLIMIMSLKSTVAVSADEGDKKTYIANFVFAEDINKNGTNLTSSSADGSFRDISQKSFCLTSNGNGEVQIELALEAEKVVVTGNAIAKTENGDTVFFKGQSTNKDYSVVYFALAYDVGKTNCYFKGDISKDSKNILQLYLRKVESATRSYCLLEAENVELNISPKVTANLEVNPMLGAWAAAEFEPVSSEFGMDWLADKEPSLKATSNTKYWYCTKTFYDMGETQSHTIRWFTNVDYANVPVGQNAAQYYRLEVYAKNMSFSVNSSFNSDTMSYLNIDGLSLDQISVKNTAWKSTTIDGYVQNAGSLSGNLSGDISVGYGSLSATLSFPISFTGSNYVDINSTYAGYLNGVGGSYTRAINTEMDNQFRLTQIGHYFSVESALRDYGNVSLGSSTMQARWHVDIVNSGNLDSYSYYCDHNVNISVY